jgi:hypothetical protein
VYFCAGDADAAQRLVEGELVATARELATLRRAAVQLTRSVER